MKPEDMERVEHLVAHIRNVQEGCFRIARRLMESGEPMLARQLVAAGFLHDNSKFYGIEWEALTRSGEDEPQQKLATLNMLTHAVRNHATVNPHHPEYWDGGIHGMPRVALAEMAADWKARSEEKGTGFREWIDGDAMKRYRFKKSDPVYKAIMEFADMLCDPPFAPLPGQK
jgi:hypothetical protein